MINLIKIGDIIHNYTEDPESISHIMVDIENKYYKNIIDNKDFVDKYSIQRCKGIVKMEPANVDLLEINQIVTSNENAGFLPLEKKSKVIEIIDNLIITDSNLFIVDDISYYRDIKLKKLGL